MPRASFVRPTVLVLIAFFAVSTDATAQVTRMGLHGGANIDREQAFIGLTGHVGIDVSGTDVLFNVTAELYPFLDDASVTVLDVGAVVPTTLGRVELYAGGGMAVRFARFDVPSGVQADDTETDIGIDVKGGLVLGDEYWGIRPFVEVDQTFGAGTDTSVRAGIFFTLGGI